MQSNREIPLLGAQQGLVLSITSEGCIVHWPGTKPLNDSSDPSRLVGMVELMPYQDGSTLPMEDTGSTEILTNTEMAESGTNSVLSHTREVFMLRQPPQIPMPQAPDVQPDDETLSNISADTPAPANETDAQKTARERKNQQRQAHCNCAQHRKEEWHRS